MDEQGVSGPNGSQPRGDTEGARAVAHLDGSREHPLGQHSESAADLAGRFADACGAGPWARLAGPWRNLGKFFPAYQRRIRLLNDPHVPERGPLRA